MQADPVPSAPGTSGPSVLSAIGPDRIRAAGSPGSVSVNGAAGASSACRGRSPVSLACYVGWFFVLAADIHYVMYSRFDHPADMA